MKFKLASKTGIAIAASGMLVLGMLGGCSSNDSGSGSSSSADSGSSGSTLAKIKKAGTVTVGIAGEAPYSFKKDGKLEGGSVAIARKVFAAMGIKNVKAQLVDWNSLIPGLNAKRFDMVSAGMSILPDRCKQAAFSDPTIMYTTALMVPKGNPKALSDMKSVVAKNGSVKLAVLSGGIEAGYAKSLKITNTISVPDAQTGIDDVTNGRADAFAMTAISLNYMKKKQNNTKVQVTKAFTADINGVKQIGSGASVFRKGDTELRKAFNKELEKLVTANDSTYLGVVGEYGFTKENLPPKDLTTKQLCAGDLG